MTVLFLLLFAGCLFLTVRLVAGHLADDIGKGLAYGCLHDPEKGQPHQGQWHDGQGAYEGKHTGSGRNTCLLILAHVQKSLLVFGILQRLLEEERPGHKLKIHLVDSHTYSMVQGWPICEAARKIRNGGEVRMAVAELERTYARSEAILAAFSLKQMKKSGRISAAAAFAGELLGLRPVISLIDGVSVVQSKVRGDAAVLPAMVKLAAARATDIKNEGYMIGYTDVACVDDLVRQCKKEFGHPPVQVFHLGAAVSSNTGPDAIALVYLGEARR